MTSRQFAILLVVCGTAAYIGAAGSAPWLSGRATWAQEKAEPPKARKQLRVKELSSPAKRKRAEALRERAEKLREAVKEKARAEAVRRARRFTVRAQRFELMDSSGQTRAVLSADSDGETSLTLRDADGRTRLTLNVGEEGTPSIALRHADARRSVFRSPAEPTLVFLDRRGRVANRLPADLGKGGGLPEDIDPVERYGRGKGDAASVTPQDIDLIWRQLNEIVKTLDEITGREE